MGFFFCCRRKKQVSPIVSQLVESQLEQVKFTQPLPVLPEKKERTGFLSLLHPQYLNYLYLSKGKTPLTILEQMRLDNHVMPYLEENDLLQAERNYYHVVGYRAPDFRKQLKHASLLASISENYRDLREYLMAGVMQYRPTIMQMLMIDNHILPACQLGAYAQASKHYYHLFGDDALPFGDLMKIFPQSDHKVFYMR